MQAYYSRVLEPLVVGAFWVVPALIVVATSIEVARSLRHRDVERTNERTPSQRRDGRALMAGAAVATVCAHAPFSTWLEARFAMLVVFPAVGASLGLVVSALVPPKESHRQRVANIQPRRLSQYVSTPQRRQLLLACSATVVIVAIRMILPAERPLPSDVADVLARPILAPTRALYLVAGFVALVTAGAAWSAAEAIVRRARPAADATSLARQDFERQTAARRVLSWSTASLLLLDAALMAPFPRMMGGVVLGDVQLIQRATDALIVVCLAVAAALLARVRRSFRDGGHVPAVV